MVLWHRRNAGRWWARLLIGVLSLSLIAGAALALYDAQVTTRSGVTHRYDARASQSADFVGTYVQDLSVRERTVAVRTLNGTLPTPAFLADARAFGFHPSVLLNAHGTALSIAPAAPDLRGQNFGKLYGYLAAALRGQVSVSNVVASATTGDPVVGFAVPFLTASGRRVFSGDYTASQTPLAAFLSDSSTLAGAQVFLIDGNGEIVASNGGSAADGRDLTARDPSLGDEVVTGSDGQYRSRSTSETFAKVAVPGTTWSLVISVPTAELYVSIDGATHWLPWLILLALSLLIGVVGYLAGRLLEGRRRLGDANHELAKIARTDGLTGLFNRLYLTEQLEAVLANSARHDFPVCVLMIDIDHFKALNDTYGHQAGDLAIRHIADRLTTSLRDGDLLGRWGGEEFLAVLPFTNLDAGLEAAERLRRLVSLSPIDLPGASGPVTIHASVGVAMAADDSLAALVDRADRGLYAAKAAGRDTVRVINADQVPAAKAAAEPVVHHDLA